MSWVKVKLGNILNRKFDSIKIIPDAKYKLVTIKLHHKGVVLRNVAIGSEIKSRMAKVCAGDFVLSGIDARNGAFGIVPLELDNAIITNDFWCLVPNEEIIKKEFLLFITSTDYFDYICNQSSDGTTQRIRLQKSKFFNYEIVIPPLPEQELILRKLTLQKQLLEEKNITFSHQLDLLKNLRQQILQDAIMGKLVPQDLNDEPAIKLLERINAEKEQLIREKKIKKEKPLPEIKSEEKLFEIPESWVWCRLGAVITMIYGESLTKAQCTVEGKYPVYGSNGIVGYYDKFLTERRTIIIGRKGSAGALNICNVPSWTTDVAFYVEENRNLNFYFSFYLIKSLGLETLGKGIKPGVNRNEVYNIPIPLPPLLEQNRIVSKIEKLIKLLYELELSIQQNQKYIQQLLQVALKEALEPKC